MKISVVMPSLNQGRFIEDAIKSVLNQEHKNIELIVIDGGSTDNTSSILERYKDRLSYVSEKDKCQSEAINKGFGKATGDIICWLNSDDMFEPIAFSTVTKAFLENPEMEFVYGNGYNVDENGKKIGPAGVKKYNLWKLLHHRNFIQQPSCFFRNSIIQETGLLREDLQYVMDWELWIRFSRGKGMFLDKYLSKNRVYSASKSVSGKFKRWKEIRRMLCEYTGKKITSAIILYFMETLVLTTATNRYFDTFFGYPMRHLLALGMEHEFSGWFDDGSVCNRFYFTVNRNARESTVIIRIKPLSAFDKKLIGEKSVEIHWESSDKSKGTFCLKQNGNAQEFQLPFAKRGKEGMVTFRCHGKAIGRKLYASGTMIEHPIIAFLDEIRTI